MRALRDAIHARKFSPAYYLHGEDEFLKDDALRRLVDAAADPATRDFNLDFRKGDDLDAAALSALLSTPPMMAERRVVVIADVAALDKKAKAVLEQYLKAPAADLLLVLVATADSKSDAKLRSLATDVEFDSLTGAQLPKWIVARAERLGASISPEAINLLQDAAGADLARLALELDKLSLYCGGREIDEAAVTAVVGVSRAETVGQLLDAVLQRDATRAVALVSGVLQQPKTSAVTTVMALTTQMLAIAVAQSRRTPQARMSNDFYGLLKSGGSTYTGRAWGEAVSAWAKYASRWPVSDADHALRVLLQTDQMLKGSRVSSEEQILANAIFAICGGEARIHAA